MFGIRTGERIQGTCMKGRTARWAQTFQPGTWFSPRGQPWSDSSACPFASPFVRSEPHEWLEQKKSGLHRRLEFGFLELMAVNS